MSTYIAGLTTPSKTYYFPFEGHSWTVYGGYEPLVQRWVVPVDVATAIMADLKGLTGKAREVTLLFGEPDNPKSIERVTVLGVDAAGDVRKRILLLTDVRWYLTYAWLNMDVNVRRRVGNKRLIGDTLTDSVVADTVAYAPWSINGSVGGGKAYDWTSLKDQVLTYLTTARHGRPQISYTTDTFNVLVLPAEIVQETGTDAEGTTGLARAIEATPGASIYVDFAGAIHVYERVPGAEDRIVKQFPKELQDQGSLVFVDYSPVRPAMWRVYLDYEIEIRFTYNPGSGLFSSDDRAAPYLEPVLQVTDQSLDITSAGAARTVGQGTWITLDEAFAAWGGVTYGTITLPTLTDDIVANHWMGSSLKHYTVGKTDDDFDAKWGRRISELMRSYRTFFRVNPHFWERVRHAWAVRAAIWDPSTGTRGPSPVYCNFNIMPVDRYASAQVYFFGKNVVDSYPSSGLLADGKPSGFRGDLVDEELGIVGVIRDLSKFPDSDGIAPSPVIDLAGIKNDVAALCDGNLQQLWHTTGDNQWKLATILSVVPASPNDLGRMYEVQVTLDDAVKAAGLAAGTVSAGSAPDKETRSHLGSARIAWQDSRKDDILKMLGTDDAGGAITTDESVTTVDPINLEQEVRPLAKAVAATELMSVLDRWEGTLAVPFSEKLAPLGSIQRIVHRVDDNRLVSVIECTPDEPPFHAADFLTGAARSFLLKEIASTR